MTNTWMVKMAALTACMAGTAAHAGEPGQKLTVYVRDRANVRSTVCIPAKALAGKMFAAIGISLDWDKGEPGGATPQPAVVIELVRGTPDNRLPGALAYALPYEGTHITVFIDRVEKTLYPSTVLAHVMVHEITHLLQGISRHSDAGVMKAHWTGRDYGRMRATPFPFTREDVDLIDLGLAKQAARTGVLVVRR